MFRKILLAAALLATLAPAGAFARPDGERVRVYHGDLNLMSAAGRAQLDKRVAAAAKRVCAINGRLDPRALSESHACLKAAMASARAQVAAAIGSTQARLSLADRGRANGDGS